MATPYKRILFIEDEVDIAEIYARTLKLSGFEVTCRYDGEAGLTEAQTNPYDLLLLDLMIPVKSGMEVLKTLRDSAKSPTFDQQTDIIILTNFEEDDATKKALLSLAQAYLLKVDITPRSLANLLINPSETSDVRGATKL